jgi:hypothetical protein
MNELLTITIDICKDFFSWWMATFKKNSSKGKWLLLCLSLVMICLIFDFPYYCFNMKSPKTTPAKTISAKTASPTATNTVAATQAATKTPAIVETNTPQPETTKSNIPGLTSGDVTANLKTKGIDCARPIKTNAFYIRNCTAEDSSRNIKIGIYGKGLLDVDYIFVGIDSFGKPDTLFAYQFMGFIATLPYTNAQPDKARSWVETNLPTLKGADDVRKQTFSDVEFALYGDPGAYFLEIGDLPEL